MEYYRCPRSYKGGSKGVNSRTSFKKYERGLIVAYVVSDDYSLMKENIQHYYTELMEKDR